MTPTDWSYTDIDHIASQIRNEPDEFNREFETEPDAEGWIRRVCIQGWLNAAEDRVLRAYYADEVNEDNEVRRISIPDVREIESRIN